MGKEVFEILELPTDATPMAVKTRWRELAKVHHPDHGGDASEFHRYRAAYTEALALAQAPVRCGDCAGTGTVDERRGFNVMKFTCRACRGTGKVARVSS